MSLLPTEFAVRNNGDTVKLQKMLFKLGRRWGTKPTCIVKYQNAVGYSVSKTRIYFWDSVRAFEREFGTQILDAQDVIRLGGKLFKRWNAKT